MSSSEKIETSYIVDTHAVVWYLTGNKRLSQTARAIFEAAERGETLLVVSAIVVAEMYFLNKKNGIFDDFAKVYLQMKAKPYFRFVSFQGDDVLNFDRDESVPEMHDRMIVGLARHIGVPIITADQSIMNSGLVSIAW